MTNDFIDPHTPASGARRPLHRIALAALLGCSVWPGAVLAQTTTPSCVEVEVNGQTAPSFGCLTQKLTPAATPPRRPSGQRDISAAEAITQRPGHQLGLFNRAATGHRMGNQFGIGVTPQRPVPAPVP